MNIKETKKKAEKVSKLRFEINLVGLENELHQLEYKADETFYAQFEPDLFHKVAAKIHVDFEKGETMIRAEFHISGVAELICDRSLEPFDYSMDSVQTVFFKYGEDEKELSDDLYMIPAGLQKLDLSQFVYEFTALAVPVKRLHPDYADDDSEAHTWTFGDNEESDEEQTNTDPRWDALRKLTK